MGTAVWPGTIGAYARLVDAANNNCDCEYENGVRTRICSAHEMLTHQDMLNRLAFVGHDAQHYLDGESQP